MLKLNRVQNDVLGRLRGVSLRQLIYLVELARSRNFRKASDVLSISQPSLSQQIKSLEETLGLLLIDRNTRAFRLTEAGEIIVDEATQVLERFGGAVYDVLRKAETPQLRVGLPGHMSYLAVTDIMQDFRRRFPSISPYYVELPARELAEELVAGHLDACFLSVPVPLHFPGTIKRRVIFKGDLALCLSRSHPLADRATITADECDKIDFILFPREYHEAEFDNQLASIQDLCPDPRIVYSGVVSAQSHIDLAAAGVGACLICPGATNLSNDVVLRPTEPPLAKSALAVFWSGRNLSVQLEKFLSCVPEFPS